MSGLGVVSDVLLARGVGDALLVSEAVETAGVAALARATGTAVDDDLSVKADRGRVLVAEHDVESVSDGAGGALGPAGATVDGDVLVLVPGEVVGVVDVAPVVVVGHVVLVDSLPGVDGGRPLRTCKANIEFDRSMYAAENKYTTGLYRLINSGTTAKA